MAAKRDKDTSLTLMMRVQKDPADPRAWDEFVQRYQPIIPPRRERSTPRFVVAVIDKAPAARNPAHNQP
jgi:hypothetical protein